MSDTHERWQKWIDRAADIIRCDDETCTPESHIVALRYALIEAYDNGLLDGMREMRDQVDP